MPKQKRCGSKRQKTIGIRNVRSLRTHEVRDVDADDSRLASMQNSSFPRARTQIALWKPTLFGGQWLVTGGIVPEGRIVDCADLKRTFRRFTLAAILFSWMEGKGGEPLPFDSPDDLVMCVAAAYTEDPAENNRRRFAVYRSCAGLLGYRERTQLPFILEYAVKKEFPDEGQLYVGFQP